MKYKKFLSFALIVGLLFINGATFASESDSVKGSEVDAVGENQQDKKETSLSQQEAEKLLYGYIKDFFNIDLSQNKEGTYSYIEFREDTFGSTATWQLSVDINQSGQYLHLYAIICDFTGELLAIRKHEGYRQDSGAITQYTFDEATNIAHNFLKTKKPELLSHLSANPQNQNVYYNYYGSTGLYPREYRVFFERQEDGVPFINQGISVGVNSATGEVVSYEYNWSDAEIPPKQNIITKQEASDIFQESLDFKVNYLPVFSYSGYGRKIKDVKLVYTPNMLGGHFIDANNGSLVDPYQSKNEILKIDVKDSEKESFKQLSKPNKTSGEVSKDDAIKIATETLNKIYDDVKIQGTNAFTNYGYNNSKIWYVEFTLGNNRMNRGSIVIDAITGEVTNINYYNWATREIMMLDEDYTPDLQWEDAYRKAIEILKIIYPDKLDQVSTEQTFIESHYYINHVKVPNLEYYFVFNREEHGIEFPHNNIRIAFDATTGQLQSLDFTWDDITLPKPDGLLDQSTALNIYMDQTEVELVHWLLPAYDISQEQQKIKLVYRLKPKNQFLFQNIDAKIGKLLDYRGEEVKPEKQKLESVSELLDGHWAEKELMIMYDNGIIDLQNFDLIDVIPKKEVIRIIINSQGGVYYGVEDIELKFTDVSEDDPYYNDIKMAVRYGIIDNEETAFNGDDFVTREELAVMLVRMAGLEKLASMEGVYTLPVKDVDDINPEYLGHTAIIYGLEIMQGQEEAYNPKEKVTLEQTAVAVYRSFKKLFNVFR